MGFCLKLTIVVLAVVIGIIIQAYFKIATPPPLPSFDSRRYWGPGAAVADDTEVTKFSINFSESEVEALKAKLVDTSRLVAPLEDVEFQYGFNTNNLKPIIDYWRDTYLPKWASERQVRLNQFPQFKTKIQG